MNGIRTDRYIYPTPVVDPTAEPMMPMPATNIHDEISHMFFAPLAISLVIGALAAAIFSLSLPWSALAILGVPALLVLTMLILRLPCIKNRIERKQEIEDLGPNIEKIKQHIEKLKKEEHPDFTQLKKWVEELHKEERRLKKLQNELNPPVKK